MDGTRKPEASLRNVLALCSLAFDGLALPDSQPGRLEMLCRLHELTAALDAVRTRYEVAALLNRTPMATYGVVPHGSTPVAAEALERLLVAANNVLALRDT